MMMVRGAWWTKSLCIVLATFLWSVCVYSAPQESSKQVTEVEYGSDVRTLTVEGVIDPRLYAYLVTTYRPNDYDKSNKDCTRSDWNTATRKGVLDWGVVEINSDKDNYYNVTVPIDYVRDKKCGYEFSSSKIQIMRDKDDDQFSIVTLLSDSQRNYDRNSNKGGRIPNYARQTRKAEVGNYRLSEGSYIQCHTDYYDRVALPMSRVIFNCYPVGGNNDHGVSAITSIDMHVDIRVNEDVGQYYYGTLRDVKSKKDRFRDYSSTMR